MSIWEDDNYVPDEKDARIAELTAEVASLKDALRPFIRHYEPWMEEHDPDTKSSSFSRHTFAELIAARNALKDGVTATRTPKEQKK